MRRRRMGAIVGWLAVLVPVAATQALQVAGEQPVDREAQRVIGRLRQQYADLPGVSVSVNMKVAFGAGGPENTSENLVWVSVAPPNRVAVRSMHLALVSDGTTFWQYMGASFKKYEEREAPESLAEIGKAMNIRLVNEVRSIHIAPHVMAMALMDSGWLEGILGAATGIKFMGRELHAGRLHDRVRLEAAQDVDLWIPAEGEAWLAKIAPDVSKIRERLADEVKQNVPRTEILFTDWQRRENFPPDTFAFKPPAGAERVAALMDSVADQLDAGREDGHADLVGKAAPEVELELLDGGRVSLASHKGKDVVILDFWAIWCAPCVQALPVVSKVAADFKDRGVVFYAVNKSERSELIREFLDERKLKFPVLLDRKGIAWKSFGVRGIPQTVLIGRDGTVKAVHVGFTDSTERELTEQLEKLVKRQP